MIRAALTTKQFDALVTRWNHLRPSDRRARSAECATNGHTYKDAPFSDSVHRIQVCTVCLTYTHGDTTSHLTGVSHQ